jgi:hypothetical protein
MDAHPDTDQLLLAYLHGVDDGAPLDGGELRIEERSDSALSLASTIAFDAAPSAPIAPRVIRAFCPFNQLIVTIPFPNEDDGWVYRYDIGGQSQHRWDFEGTLALLSRHSTCKKTIEMRRPCRNCIMKDIWRRECTQPENAFFLCAIVASKDPTPALNKLIVECDSVPPDMVKLYQAHMPKLNSARKRRFDEETKRKQLARMITQIGARDRLDAPQNEPAEVVDDFMHLIGDALGMNGTTTQGLTHVDSYDSELADLAPLQAVDDSAAPPPAIPNTCSDIAAAYGTLLGLFSSNKRASVCTDFIRKLQTDFPAVFSADAMTVPCDALTALLQRIGVVLNAPMLLAKSIFPPWMARLKSRCRESPVQVSLGFYRAPSCSIHAEFCTSSTTPSFISSGRHRVDEPYSFSGSLSCTILVLYIVDPCNSLVAGNDILPIANLE